MMHKTNRFFFQEEDREYYISLFVKDYKEAYQTYRTWYSTGKGDTGIGKFKELNQNLIGCEERSLVDYLKYRMKIRANDEMMMTYLFRKRHNEFTILWHILKKVDRGEETTEFLEKISKLVYTGNDITIIIYYALMVLL